MKRFTGIQTQALTAAVLSLFFACAGTPATERQRDPTPAPGKVIFRSPRRQDLRRLVRSNVPARSIRLWRRLRKVDHLPASGGEYTLVKRLELNARGTEGGTDPHAGLQQGKARVRMLGADRSGLVAARHRPARGCYWYLQGIEVTGAYNEGFRIVNGSHNTFDRCVAHHNGGSGILDEFRPRETGRTASEPRRGRKPPGTPSSTAIRTTISTGGPSTGGVPAAGTNADGFAVKQGSGRGNRFIGCRALEQLRRCVGPLRMRSRRGDDRLLGMAHGAS